MVLLHTVTTFALLGIAVIGVKRKHSLYDSLSLLEEVLETQTVTRKHVEHFKTFIHDEPEKEKVLEDFVFRCRREEEIAKKVGYTEYLSNPINAFSLVTRMSKDLVQVEQILNETGYLRDGRFMYPQEHDLVGAVEGFTRLQILYDLPVYQLANGTLTSRFAKKEKAFVEYVRPMTAADCYELGLVQYHDKDRSRNIAWMMQGLKKYLDGDNHNFYTAADFMDRIAGEYHEMEDYGNAIIWLQNSMSTTPFHRENEVRRKVLATMQNQLINQLNEPAKTWKLPKVKSKIEDSTYPGLCVRQMKYDQRNNRLRCFYKSGPNKYLTVAPVKTELLNESPVIVMYHNVISDAEIAILQTLAKPKFSSGIPTTPAGANTDDHPYCVHQVAWLPDHTSETTKRLARRIAQITDLNVDMKTAEMYQVANYGIGGFYGPHFDFIRQNSTTIAKRYATILFYLTDIKFGGATIFTNLNLTVYPQKHSALFWKNLDPWGRKDFMTRHAACPVLLGDRWITSKWISLSGQELMVPCPVTKPVKRSRGKIERNPSSKIQDFFLHS